MEYTKASMAGKQTRDYIKNLVFNDILLARDMKPDISVIINKLRAFEKSIKKSIMDGEYTYFKTANIKTGDAYDSPLTIGTYKAAYVWNYLCPDNEIELPGVAYIAKVDIKKVKDVAHLSTTFPVIYQRFQDLFNLDVQVVDRKTGEKRVKKFGDAGITNIAIPLDCKVPEWLKPLIDTTEIIENNTRLILSNLNALGVKTVYKTKGSQFVSNIVEV